MNLEDFIVSYPHFDDYEEDIFKVYEDTTPHVIFRKKEFNINKLPQIEQRTGKLLLHQQFISNFLSPTTLYDGLLLFNEIGTGKTRSAIAVSEKCQEMNPKLHRTLVITKGENIQRNFITELAFNYNPEKYLPENYELLTEGEKTRRVNKLVDNHYEFTTFITFVKEISKYSDEVIRKAYSNRVIIIDEVHNLRIQDKKNRNLKVYENIHRFLHAIENKKVVLLSATPMKDKPDEIGSVMNLLLPLDNQMETGDEFNKEYFSEGMRRNDEGGGTKLQNIQRLKNFLYGRVSYLRSMSSNVVKNYVGQVDKSMKKIPIIKCEMDEFQSKYYNKFYKQDTQSSKRNDEGNEREIEPEEDDEDEEESKAGGLYDKSRQASLFVYPDGSTGSEGFLKYLQEVKKGSENWVLTRDFEKILTNNSKATQSEILDNIEKYSCKYAEVLREILKHPNEKIFVYSKFVKGSGIILFGELLRILNFKKYDDNRDGKKYAVISRKTTTEPETERILNIFNNPDNKYGENLQIIVGSQIIGEGRTLKSVRQIHVLTPHWNNSETEQAIGRGIRAFSHDDLPDKDRYIKVYRWCSIPIKGESIDLYLFQMSEIKDLKIKQVERVCKIMAVDCQLNKKRNLLSNDKNNTVECLYDKCEYKCDGFEGTEYEEESDEQSETELITDTYNLFYGEKEIEAVISLIKQLYRKKFSYDISEIQNTFLETPKIILIRALKMMIDNNIEVNNRFGFINYLREEKNMYFLVDIVSAPNNFTLNYYSKNPKIGESLDFETIIKISQYKYLKNKLDIIVNEDSKEEIINQLKLMPLDIQELFLKLAIENPNTTMSQIVIDLFQQFISKVGNKIVINLLSFQCYFLGKWSDCDEDLELTIKEEKKVKKKKLESDSDYYGIIPKNKTKDDFKIKFKYSQKEADIRLKPRGIKCMTIVPVQKISNVAVQLGIPVPDEYELDLSKKNVYIKELLKINREVLEKEYKEYTIKYTRKELEDMDEDEFKRIYYWYHTSKKTTCDSIRNYFDENDLWIIEE